VRRLLILLLLLTAAAGAVRAAVSWESQTNPTSQILNGVYALNANSAVAVGGKGIVLKTSDGGSSWISKASEDTNTVHYAVSFPTSSTGYVAGSYYTGTPQGIANVGNYAKSTTAGETWPTSGTATNSRSFYDIFAVDTSTVYATGTQLPAGFASSNLFKSADGGSTWAQPTNTGLANTNYFGLHFADANTGWVVGAGSRIYKTIDGGANWISQNPPLGYTSTPMDVFFIDSNTGWVVGTDGTILKTTNGGSLWASKTSGTGNWLAGVHFINQYLGYAVGQGGKILFSADSGEAWETLTAGTNADLIDIHFSDAFHGWAVGSQEGAGVIYKFSPNISASPTQRPLAWSGNVTINGANFHPSLTITNVSFTKEGSSAGITVNAATRESHDRLVANISVAPACRTGSWDIVITDPGGGSITATSAFSVSWAPTVTSVYRRHPTLGNVSWDRCGALRQITAEGTGFQTGAVLSFSGTGISVSATSVLSSTELAANISIAETAATGFRDATVTNPDTGAAALTNAFEIRANSVGPTISNIAIAGAETAASKVLRSYRPPPITFNVEDITGMSTQTANVKIIIGDTTDEYYWEYPGSSYPTAFSPEAFTSGSGRIVLYKLKSFATGAIQDATSILTSPGKKLWVYAEDAEGNPGRALYDTLYYAVTLSPGERPISRILFFPNPNPRIIQIECKEELGDSGFYFRGMDGIARSFTYYVKKGTTNVSYDGTDHWGHPLSNGIYLLTVTNPRFGVAGTGKIVIAH